MYSPPALVSRRRRDFGSYRHLLFLLLFNISLPVELNTAPDNQAATVHLSVLYGSQMLDVYRCPDPSRCHFPCKSNRRYHCPLCDNKPQKPGRMRRHFFTMHAGKHVIEHEGRLISDKILS